MRKWKQVVFAFLLVSAFLLYGYSTTSFAQETEPMIRIGVVPSAESIKMRADGPFNVLDKGTGEILFSGNGEEVTVTLGSAAQVRSHYRLQVAFTTSQAYLDDWLARAHAEGYSTYLEDYNGGYRLYLGEFPADASFSVRTAFKDEVVAKGLAASDAFWKIVTTADGERQLSAKMGSEEKITRL